MKKLIAILLLGMAFAGQITERIYLTPTANGKYQSATMTLIGNGNIISVNNTQGLTIKAGSGGVTLNGALRTSGAITGATISCSALQINGLINGVGNFINDDFVLGSTIADSNSSQNITIGASNEGIVAYKDNALVIRGSHRVPANGKGFGSVRMFNTTTLQGHGVAIQGERGGADVDAELVFYTTNTATLNERIRITSTGLVNIQNTVNATTILDGSLQTDGGLSVVKDAVIGGTVSASALQVNGGVTANNGSFSGTVSANAFGSRGYLPLVGGQRITSTTVDAGVDVSTTTVNVVNVQGAGGVSSLVVISGYNTSGGSNCSYLFWINCGTAYLLTQLGANNNTGVTITFAYNSATNWIQAKTSTGTVRMKAMCLNSW